VIKKLFIANRGEIALRIVRAARELGIQSVVGHSRADADSAAVRLADSAIEIGAAPPSQSYLNIDAVLTAVDRSGADAVHPGYGFLSENADFAQAVVDAGRIFVGPSPSAIRTMGNKAAAIAAARAAGVPTVPGSGGTFPDVAAALVAAGSVGYPVMIKAVAGGGGRGIRIAADATALASEVPVARAEAQAAFGDGALYLERFVDRARHIEVQILADGQRAIHLCERDCSLQRRRQKILEEAPAPGLDADLRRTLCESAVRLAESVGYSGAGTMEYLYDASRSEFFFIEMNTRIQVEHPITEMITGVDLVQEMLRIAGGEPLRLQQSDIVARGHSIECRINAEDPEHGFMPSPGRLTALALPAGPGVRVDTLLLPGCLVTPYYDSLLAKLIVWAGDRESAIARMERALGELTIEGLKTTTAFHRRLLRDPAVRAGAVDTGYLEREMLG
jgi:acetyl-CoA carboxylase biotin carboxylase subunit